MTFEDFYARAARVRNLQLAQVNSVEDGVQVYFLRELGHTGVTLVGDSLLQPAAERLR